MEDHYLCQKLILAINAGSSSLKFQLIRMPEEELVTKGLVERIGLKDSIFTIEVDGEKVKNSTRYQGSC
uniref:butyrate kinase n=1 Tax=Staphylococcus schleiferi TaxID=1295 RepID=A0A7Z7QZX0_STASC|nr:Acetate kinase [Staphylococcus schleiferi]